MKKLFVCAMVMVMAFSAPALATDWDFYGNFQFDTISNNTSKEKSGTGYSDTDTTWASTGISRFGGKVTKGDIFGNVEFNDGGNIRHLYGEWNFGAGKLLIGQTWDLSFQGGSLQNAGGGISNMFGASGTRDNMMRLTFGGLQIGLKTPAVKTVPGAAIPYTVDADVSLPALELKYTFATDMFTIQPYLGWQSVDYVYNTTDQSSDLTSTVWAVMGKVNFGAAYVNARVWGGTNVADFGFAPPIDAAADWNATTNKFDDNTSLCYGVVVGFKMSDTITIEGGYSGISSEETAGTVKTEVTGASEYYILADIQLAPGVVVQPQYMKVNYGDTKVGAAAATKNGDDSYFGANWVISF